MSSRCRSDCRIGATSGHVKPMPRSVHRHPDACTVGHSALLRCPGCPVRRPVSQVAKKRRRALCAALQEHQAKQIQARADLIALGIAPERAPWRRIRREAQEEMAEEQRFARRQAAALERTPSASPKQTIKRTPRPPARPGCSVSSQLGRARGSVQRLRQAIISDHG